jgi:magnesium-transporting ATPase (P-type)
MRWSPSTIELLWTSLAFIGIIASIIGIMVQAKDYRAARQLDNGLRNRRLIVTWMMLRGEIVSVIVQGAFLLVGILALFTPGGRDLDEVRSTVATIVLYGFVVAQITLVASTLLRRRDRQHLRRIVENNE